VRVFERSAAALQARGAGIAALPATLRYLTERGGRSEADVCSSTDWIRFLGPDGGIEHEQRHRYLFSSWNTIYSSLLEELDPGSYLLDREVTGFSQDRGRVRVTLADGGVAEAELLVCADGVSSLARAALLPEVLPSYSGYVAWRGTLPERELTAATSGRLSDAITYQVMPGSHILVYPIPGPHGELTKGDRLVNFVWYVNVAAGEALDELMTGRDGVRRAVSLPPGAATDEAVAVMRRSARARLAPALAEVAGGVAEPFVQAVYDIGVPTMAFGRICLIGDAAFAVRPHAAAGTAKAAADGWALAEALTAAAGDVPAALASWERRQLALGRALLARCRDIGDSSQFGGTFRPGDRRLIFGLHGPGN
jgi:2,6-dihydroxypyridine 3-monooxygenase